MATANPSRRRVSHLSMPSLLRNRRGVVSRAVFRLPLMFYHCGLGWLFGHQFLVLTHAGRRTGRVHETVLKVLHYDPVTQESIVASAWGERTDWYRNIRAHPALAVRTGTTWYVPQLRILPFDEAFAVFEDWTRRQRWFAQIMLGQVGQSLHVSEAQRRMLVASFPFVAFSPTRAEASRSTWRQGHIRSEAHPNDD